MTYYTIPSGEDSHITIPSKAEKPQQKSDGDGDRIGVSVKRAAGMLDLSERTVWNLWKQEKIRATKVGTRVIVSVQSLRDFIDGKKTSNPETE